MKEWKGQTVLTWFTKRDSILTFNTTNTRYPPKSQEENKVLGHHSGVQVSETVQPFCWHSHSLFTPPAGRPVVGCPVERPMCPGMSVATGLKLVELRPWVQRGTKSCQQPQEWDWHQLHPHGTWRRWLLGWHLDTTWLRALRGTQSQEMQLGCIQMPDHRNLRKQRLLFPKNCIKIYMTNIWLSHPSCQHLSYRVLQGYVYQNVHYSTSHSRKEKPSKI